MKIKNDGAEMTKKKAIEILESWSWCGYDDKEIAIAIEMGAEALKEQKPHGEWKETARRVQVDETAECRVFETHFFYSCPICGAEYGNRKPEHPFCKWCGADLRKEGENK